jgi:hypothetical protein
MSRLRKHTWAISITLLAYLVFASVGTAMACLCCCADAHVKPDCRHSDGSGMPRETASSKEHHQHTGAEKPSITDYTIHCSCQSCVVIGAAYTHAVNAAASSELNGLTAAAWFTSVTPSPGILTTGLSPPGPSPHSPAFAGLQSEVLLI